MARYWLNSVDRYRPAEDMIIDQNECIQRYGTVLDEAERGVLTFPTFVRRLGAAGITRSVVLSAGY